MIFESPRSMGERNRARRNIITNASKKAISIVIAMNIASIINGIAVLLRPAGSYLLPLL